MPTALIQVSLVDGMRIPLRGVKWTARISDGQPLSSRKTHPFDDQKRASEIFEVPCFGNLFDNYTVVVSASGYEDSGWHPVSVIPQATVSVQLMTLPKRRHFNFATATWNNLHIHRPALADYVRCTCENDEAANEKYSLVLERRPEALATFLSVMTALADITLPSRKTPLDYYWNLSWPSGDCKQTLWLEQIDLRFKRDRFFCYVESTLLDDIREARRHGTFTKGFTAGHPGATETYKQNQFDVSNVQLSFHGRDVHVLMDPVRGPVRCIKIEPDIDYFSDVAAHLLLEYIPNHLTGGKTDPAVAYALRWTAAKREGIREFDPLFGVEADA